MLSELRGNAEGDRGPRDYWRVIGGHILRFWEGEDAESRITVEIRPFVDASGKTGTLVARFAIESVR